MHRLKLDLYDFPELYTVQGNMAKLASITGGESLFKKEELNLLPDSDFALIIKEGAVTHRKFPIVDKPNAYASALLFGKTKDQMPTDIRNKVASSITAAIQGKAHDATITTADKFKAFTKISAMQDSLSKRASLQDADFALVITNDDTKRRLYPIYTEKLCKTAAKYFEENYTRMPVDFRHKFAQALTNKVKTEKYPIKLGSEIKQYYSEALHPNVDAAIISRKALIKDPKIKQAYDLLLAKKEKAHPVKIAHILRQIDKLAGLNNSKYIKDAYVSVFSTEATIEKKAAVTIVGDYQFDPNTLQTLPYDKFSSLFSPEDYATLQSSPVDNFKALPKTYQSQVASLAQR